MVKRIVFMIVILALNPLRVFSNEFETIDANTDVLKGHIYEVKSSGSVPKGQGIYIDIVIDPSEAEIIIKRLKFKVGSDWGVVSNDSKDTIHLDTIKKAGESGVVVIGSEAQDTDEITVKIALSAFDRTKGQFTEALVDIIGEVGNGTKGENLTLSLKNLHLMVIKVR